MTPHRPCEVSHGNIIWRSKIVGTGKTKRFLATGTSKKLGEQRHVFFPAELRWTNAKYDFIDLVTDAYNHFIKNFYLK